MIKKILAFTVGSFFVLNVASANIMDEFDPFAENVEELLDMYDQIHLEQTGISAFEVDLGLSNILGTPVCVQKGCAVYAQVVKSEQKLYLYIHGILQGSWLVSTGRGPRYETPLFNTNPNGRIYDRYSSSAYPGGDYNGLGNMPYAVFIKGGFALHGTAESNWPNLGSKASHGCIRMHPDNGFYINRLIRQAGVQNSWISVQN